MARLYYNQQAFNYGELGNYLWGRGALPLYSKAGQTCLNYRPAIQGPLVKRKGSVFVNEVKDSADTTRLVKFIFSETDSVILEFGDLYIRFYSGTTRTSNASQAITAITKANPAVVTYTGSDTFANGDHVYISGVVGMVEVNNRRFTVANVNTGANTFELSGVNSTAYTTYTSGGILEEPYEIATTYTQTDLAALKFAQIGDIMYISSPNFKPRKLSRLGATNWTIADVDYQMGPCKDFNEGATTITLSGTLTDGGTSTWTASASLFVDSDVGTVWAIAKSTDTSIVGYAKMAGFTSDTVATFTNQVDLTPVTVTASTNWKYPSWSATYGWPRAVAFHEQRLFFGGNATEPLTVWGSTSNGSYENFDIGTAAADDALIFELSGAVNTIQWLKSNGNFLVGGTYGGLSFIGSSDFSGALTPTNVKARVGASYGSSITQGVQINDVMLYLHSNTKSVYKAKYDDVTLQYIAYDFNDLNTDILSEGVIELDTAEQPDNAVIGVGSDGNLKLLSYDETQGSGGNPLLGWYEYDLGGDVKSVAVVPTTGDDRIWLIVERTINATTKKYIEYIDISADDFYVDCGFRYSGAATRSITGLHHLEGETVSVWGDGSYAGDYTVSAGIVTIPTSKTAIEEAYIGLAYDADWLSMPIVIPLQETGNTTHSVLTRVNELQMVLYKTAGILYVGPSFDKLIDVPFRTTYDPMTEAPPLFGNDVPDVKQVNFNGTFGRQVYIAIRHNLPLPCTVIGFTARMEANPN